jgi:hypothetical protein
VLSAVSARTEQGAGQRVMLAVHFGEHLGEMGAAEHRRTLTGPQ